MKLIIGISLFLCPYITRAQSLSIGEQLPPPAMQLLQTTGPQWQTVNGKSTKHNPAIYLLDFWATWCSSCLKNLPKASALQSQYNSNMQLVLINSSSTGDNNKKITGFFKKYYAAHPAQLPFRQLNNDSIFTALFPFESVPHYVWISSNGTVLAITGSQDVNAQNISRAIAGEPLQLPDKAALKNLQPGSSIFFQNENRASLATTGAGFADTARRAYLPGYLSFTEPGFQSLVVAGQPLLSIIRRTLLLKSNRMRISLPATHALLSKPVNAELVLPQNCTVAERNQALLQLLNNSFALYGRMQTVDTTCYLLTVSDTTLFLKKQHSAALLLKAGKDSVLFKNKSPLYITNSLSSVLPQNAHWPLITADTSKSISLVLPNHSLKNNIPALQKALQPWGLQLIRTRRPLLFFVLEQASQNPSLTKSITAQ